MFEGNAISSEDNAVTLLSKKNRAGLWKIASFLWTVLSFENASHSFEGNASLTKKETEAPHGGVIFALKMVKHTGIYSVLWPK